MVSRPCCLGACVEGARYGGEEIGAATMLTSGQPGSQEKERGRAGVPASLLRTRPSPVTQRCPSRPHLLTVPPTLSSPN